MAPQTKLIFLFLGLALARLSSAESQLEVTKRQETDHSSGGGSVSVLDGINSLEHTQQAIDVPLVSQQAQVTAPTVKSSRRRSKSKSLVSRRQQQQPIAILIANLLNQLERADFRRVLSDLVASSSSAPLDHAEQRSASSGKVYANKSADVKLASAPASQQQRDGKLNVSALSAESGNLLSITKQLVKLARNQVLGNEFGHYFAGSPSWSSPLMPSMLSAASYALHDSLDFGGHSTGASLKNEWFWWVAPAVIVIGTGVIVLPLIAAWLVSQAMSQNTFTVSAGRRRRRRSAPVASGDHKHHLDLFKLLNIHRLLDDAPELLVEQLSRLHDALDHVGAQFLKPNGGQLERKSIH